MKLICGLFFAVFMSSAFAVRWTYQVNIDGDKGQVQTLRPTQNAFEAGPYNCQVTPTTVANKTEYRTLVCGIDTAMVSTGGLCTQRGAKSASVQYAILNMTGPKRSVNVVVACNF